MERAHRCRGPSRILRRSRAAGHAAYGLRGRGHVAVWLAGSCVAHRGTRLTADPLKRGAARRAFKAQSK